MKRIALVVALGGTICGAALVFVGHGQSTHPTPSPATSISSRPAVTASWSPSPSASHSPVLSSPGLVGYGSPEQAAQRFVTQWETRPAGDTEAARQSRVDAWTPALRAKMGSYATDSPIPDATQPVGLVSMDTEHGPQGQLGLILTETIEIQPSSQPTWTRQDHFELTIVQQPDGSWLVDEARIS